MLDRRALRRALRGVDRVFHVAGHDLAAPTDGEVFEVNVKGTRIVLEECLRAGRRARGLHLVGGRHRPGAPRLDRGRDAALPRRLRRSPTSRPSARPRSRRCALAARGLPVVIVNPGHVFGRGDLYRSSTDVVRRFLSPQIPAYVDGAINIVDVNDVAAGHLLADERGGVGERYILGNRNYTWDRLFADLGRISGVEPPALKLPVPAALAFAKAAGRAARQAADHADRGARGLAVVGLSATRRPSASSAGGRLPTRTPSRRPSPGTASARATASRDPGPASPSRCASRASPCARPVASPRASPPDRADGDPLPLRGPPPTGCAPAGAWRASLRRHGVGTTRSASPIAGASARRSTR